MDDIIEGEEDMTGSPLWEPSSKAWATSENTVEDKVNPDDESSYTYARKAETAYLATKSLVDLMESLAP